MTLDDRFANVQAEAESYSRYILCLDPFHLMEALPDARMFLWWQTRSVIAHRNTDLVVSYHTHLNLDRLTLRRIFMRISQKVNDHLADTISIRKNRNRPRHRKRHGDCPRRSRSTLILYARLDDVSKLSRATHDLELGSVDAYRVYEIAHQAIQAFRLALTSRQ